MGLVGLVALGMRTLETGRFIGASQEERPKKGPPKKISHFIL